MARAARNNQIIIEDGYDSQLLDEAPQQALKTPLERKVVDSAAILGRRFPRMAVRIMAGAKEAALDRLSEDDNNPNSVFTRILIPALQTPGQSLLDIAYEVNEEVANLAETIGHQHQR